MRRADPAAIPFSPVIRGFESWLIGALCAWQDAVHRRPGVVVALVLVVTLPLGVYAATHLGINADNKLLLAPDLAFQRAAADYARDFPTLDDSLLILVEGDSPEQVREATQALEARLAARPDAFTDVFAPGGGPFFERYGLLYRSEDDLYDFGDSLAAYQPLLAELAREPSLSTLSRLIRLGLESFEDSPDGASAWPGVLEQFSRATVAVYAEYPLSVSWESLLLEGSAFDPQRRRVLVAEPVLDFDSLLAAGPAMEALQQEARALGFGPERGVRIRVTGNPALNYEEMRGLIWDVGVAGIFSFALVTMVLWRALRSGRMVAAAASTLLIALVWTAAIAAATVGRLSLVSITFAVLFIGLGVDFGIHFGLRYTEALREGLGPREAAHHTCEHVGASLVVCAFTTAIGFYSFIPTDYRGVGELGWIAGTGMFVILFHTLTLFPALLGSWLAIEPGTLPPPRPQRLGWLEAVNRRPGAVCTAAAVLALGSLALVPRLRFDPDVVRLRDPDTPSVQAFETLLAERQDSPWYANVVTPDADRAAAVAAELRSLPEVERTLTLADFVPEQQDEKLEILADLDLLLDFPRQGEVLAGVDTAEQVAALGELHAFLASEPLEGSTPVAESARMLRRELGRFLERVAADPAPEAALAELEGLLLGRFPAQLERLQTAVSPGPVGLEDLPEDLVARMRSPSGLQRIQVFPAEDLDAPGNMEEFADAVRSVDRSATGLPINLVEFGRATARSLRQALGLALASIALLLLALWRRPLPVAAALAPLLLAALLTAGAMALFDLPFTFVNVVVLPLLLGMGVDSGIHLVQRARHPADEGQMLAGTVTGRAVFYSALTTIASFGSLGFSAHRGIASMGTLLVVAMIISLLSNLVVLPALLQLVRDRFLRDEAKLEAR